jgi:hypothetical protein
MAMQLWETLRRSLEPLWLQFLDFSPRLAAALVLLLGGWLLAKLVRRLSVRVMKLLRLDVAAEKAGIEDFLVQGGVRYTAVTLLGHLAYWVFIFAAVLSALHVLGLETADELLRRIVFFIPNVIIAVLVLLFGGLVAKFARGAAYAYLNNIGIQGAAFLSNLTQGAILVFSGLIALEQLGIAGQILTSAFQIAFGALCLALALAFGLGGRRWAAQVLDRVSKQ